LTIVGRGEEVMRGGGGGEEGVRVLIGKGLAGMELDSAGLRKLVEAVCGRFGVSEATVSIAVVDDVEFRKLNKRFLNRRGSSDCLSFDLSDEKEADSRRLF
jgi:ssRNA-specific RNase YbeY (16S rRNA maturation enzyme)